MGEFFQWIVNLIKQFRFFFTVLPWELAVRTRMGKNVCVLQPGWHFRWPFIDDLSIVNTRMRVCHTGTQTLTTRDGKTVSIGFSIGFSVRDPYQSLLKFQNPEHCVPAIIQSATADYVWSKSAAEVTVPSVEREARMALEEQTASALDIDFVRVCDLAVVRTYRIIQGDWKTATTVGERTI